MRLLAAGISGVIGLAGLAGTYVFLTTEGGPENLSGLLHTHVETGVFMSDDNANLAPAGTLYEIRYWPDGTFDYTSHEMVKTGYYRVTGSMLCRSFNPLGVGNNCVQVIERHEGGFEARDVLSNDVRYSFLLE